MPAPAGRSNMRMVAWLAFMMLALPVWADNALNDRYRAAFDRGELPGLHGVIARHKGATMAELYFKGADERWGRSLGARDHGPETLHDLRSVTKSVVGLLYGIALAEGKVPPPEAPLYAQFPEYADLGRQAGRYLIRVEHALTMRMGLAWNENLPYTDPRNSEIAMERAPDRYRFVLEQRIIEAPGGRWIYSGGAVAVLARLIEKGTGMPVDQYAKVRLFDPLGIKRFEWVAGRDGVPSAASGLRLTLPDLARLGQMIVDGGVYEGRRVVPEAWLDRSFRGRVRLGGTVRYGYLWYMVGAETAPTVFGAGNGGQRLTLSRQAGLVVANFAGRYNDPEVWRLGVAVVDMAVTEARKRMLKK